MKSTYLIIIVVVLAQLILFRNANAFWFKKNVPVDLIVKPTIEVFENEILFEFYHNDSFNIITDYEYDVIEDEVRIKLFQKRYSEKRSKNTIFIRNSEEGGRLSVRINGNQFKKNMKYYLVYKNNKKAIEIVS